MHELLLRLNKLGEHPAKPCPVGKLIGEMDDETRAAFESVLSSRAATRAIHTELKSAGIRISRDTLSDHRNGWCRCKAVAE